MMNKSKLSQIFLPFAAILLFYASNPTAPPKPPQISDQVPVNFKIAFIGDQGLGENSRAVLNLIKREGAQAVLHQGDFDYNDDPPAWEAQIDAVLGPNFPYFACAGNHDEARFRGANGYQSFLEARMNRLGLTWDGDLGVRSSFLYKGIFIVLTAPDVLGSGHGQYIKEKLAQDKSIWRISSWHKNMKAMQVGGKSDESGWEVYEESRRGGAIIATAHEHSYSRTYLLSSCQNQTVASTSDTLILKKDDPRSAADEGRTFVFVSGLGGKTIRDQELSGDWWASIYTSNQNANHGALFGVFNFNGVANLAHFYFKNIDGAVPDSFYVLSEVKDISLPVELAFFRAASERNQVTLRWETRTETNNLGFDVERSTNRNDYDKIGFIGGNGSTVATISYEFKDTGLQPGNYFYRLRQIDLDGAFTISSAVTVTIAAPATFSLEQNFPNPLRASAFNPETEIRFALPRADHVVLVIFDTLGQKVRTLAAKQFDAGYHTVRWDGTDNNGSQVTNGIYFYRIQAGDFSRTMKMNLLRSH